MAVERKPTLVLAMGGRRECWGRKGWSLGTAGLGKLESNTESGRGSDLIGRKGSSQGNKKK